MVKVDDAQIIWASEHTKSAAEASRLLGINYKTYKMKAERLGVFRTNQSGAGVTKERCRKYQINDNIFDTLDSYEKAYWLGFIAADGSVVKNTLRFMLKSEDSDHLEKFLKFSESNYPIGYCTSHYKDIESGVVNYFKACYVKITSENIVRSLSKYGIVSGKKYKDIDFLSYIPYVYKKNFIAGIFDGDGSVGIYDNNRCITIAVNKSTCISVSKLFDEIGVKYSTQHRKSIDVVYIREIDSIRKFYNFYKMTTVMNRKASIIARMI